MRDMPIGNGGRLELRNGDIDTSNRHSESGRRASRLGPNLARIATTPNGLLGLAILLTFVVLALGAHLLAPFPPNEILIGDPLTPPSGTHLLGTDRLGRDIFSRLLFGARISLTIGFISVGIGASIGVIVGLATGYYGGIIDSIGMRLIDLQLAFPKILLAIVIVAVLGPGLVNLMVAIGLASVPSYARVIRGSVLSTKENPYIEACRALGVSHMRAIGRHILPNVMAPIIVLATLELATALLSGSALSFLGLGVQRPTPEWGAMVSDGRNFIASAWWISVVPGLAIFLVVLALNLLGDALRDALDPEMT